jgi:hypothetical protein
MDIAALSMDLKQVQLQQAVGTAVLQLALNTDRQNADMLTKVLAGSAQVIEQSVNPHLGSNLDVTV